MKFKIGDNVCYYDNGKLIEGVVIEFDLYTKDPVISTMHDVRCPNKKLLKINKDRFSSFNVLCIIALSLLIYVMGYVAFRIIENIL